MNEPICAAYKDIVQNALTRHRQADAGDALCAFVWLLRDRHRAAVTAAAFRAYREGFEFPDPNASTIAERIRDLAAGAATMPWPDVGVERDDVLPGYNLEAMTSGMQVVAEVLEELIPLWDYETMEDAAAAARHAR